MVRRFIRDDPAERKRAANRAARAETTRQGQEIGLIPEVSDASWNRRVACLADPERFLRTYFDGLDYFSRPFCADHRRAIGKYEDSLVNVGKFALSMPRGFGKTTMSRGFVIRALAKIPRSFAFLVGAASGLAMRSLIAIKRMMIGSTLYDHKKKCYIEPTAFAQDFPEIVYPAIALGRTTQRQGGQTCYGAPTDIHWSGNHITLANLAPQPTLRPAQLLSGGSIAMASGLLGSDITGLNVNGRRPTIVVFDDCQTRESAMKDAASQKREEIIDAMVMGLGGGGSRVSTMMLCTVIRDGDLSTRFMDHVRHPDWTIERTKFLKSMPTNMKLWEENKNILNNFNPYGPPEDKARARTAATEHYIDHQLAMDEGAVAAWPEHVPNADEVTAIQTGMNLFGTNKRTFFAEMQNEPLPPDYGTSKQLTVKAITSQLSQILQFQIPMDAGTVTLFVDVQKQVLFYAVVAWTNTFSAGYVIDYGTFPDQGRHYFTLADLPRPLDGMPDAPKEEEKRIAWALGVLTDRLMTREWVREKTGAPAKIDLGLIDSGNWSQIIYHFCRRTPHRILASKGMPYNSSSKKGTGEGAVEPGDKRGYHWHLPAATEERGVKLLLYDTNPWKSFVRSKILAGGLKLFGNEPDDHLLFADHAIAEFAEEKINKRLNKTVEEWISKAGRPDNHYWDCLIGSAAAASVQGVTMDGVETPKVVQQSQSLSQLAAAARGKSISEQLR